MTPWHISMVWGIVLTELKLMVKMPRSDASIEMFIVNSKHRGRGIGTELVDRFLRAAKEARSTLVTVYSDDRMSNWQFYERYGFEKIGTFHDNITSFYSGGDARGIILALDLRDEG
jgi:ribosomal protein S18 acetylase RimI-like enzyme